MEVVQGFGDISLAVVVECDVGGVVVVFVHLLQLGVLQVDDVLGVSPRVVDVGCPSEQLLVDLLHELPVGVLVGAFHLIQHYALQLFIALRVDLEPPALLSEVQLVQPGPEGHVEVNFVQISPVIGIGGGEGVAGEIVAGPGVHVGAD